MQVNFLPNGLVDGSDIEEGQYSVSQLDEKTSEVGTRILENEFECADTFLSCFEIFGDHVVGCLAELVNDLFYQNDDSREKYT